MYLDLGCNQLTKVPSFPENCCSKITTLILRNNDLDNLQGMECLFNGFDIIFFYKNFFSHSRERRVNWLYPPLYDFFGDDYFL